MKRVSAITNPHGQPIDLLRQFRIEPEYVARRNDARYPALHQIDRSGHGAEVNTFGRRALLDIGYIALQCFSENCIERSRSQRASTHACTTRLSVEPCDERVV